jgi:ketosteroid isomerase-like protein
MATTTIAEDFFATQVRLLEAGDTTALAERYTEDAVLIRFDLEARGRDGIKKMFDDYLTRNPEVGEMAGVKITEDLALYQASERLDGKLYWAVGTLYFENGLVKRQTATFVERPSES